MTELPRTALDKLARQQPATPHPDADLLTGFVEGGLNDAERSVVLNHVAACAQCREVLALAAPEAVPEPEFALAAAPASSTTQVPARASWFRWPVLRWGAVVAAVVVVTAALALRPWRTTPRADRVTIAEEAATPAEKPAPAPGTKAPESIPPQTRGNMADKRPVAPEKKEKAMAVAKPPARKVAPEIYDRVDGQGRQRESDVAVVAGATASAKPSATDSAEVARAQKPESAAGAMARRDSGVAPAAPPASRPPAAAQSAEAETEAVAPGEGVGSIGKLGRASKSANADTLVYRKGAQLAGTAQPVGTKARWTISPEGQVERSLDGGQTWVPVVIVRGAKFRTVSAVENDVWAGGDALYHSSDAGQHWTRVALPTGNLITRIDFSGPRSGQVTTTAGEVWTTDDAGRTWSRK
jgi:hypothetical protein